MVAGDEQSEQKSVVASGREGRDSAPGGNNMMHVFAVNRNKQSIAVDLKTGKESVKQLLSKSDVLIENFIPGVMDKLGLGYEEMVKVNPNLIYCSISGFGSDSPRPGYDVMVSQKSQIHLGFENRIS